MEKRKKRDTWNKIKVSHMSSLLLVLLQITAPSSAQNTSTTVSVSTVRTSTQKPTAVGYITRPANVAVGEGDPAGFICGVASASPNLTFTFYGSQRIYNLTCPYSSVEAIPQTLYGSCNIKNGLSLAMWTLSSVSLSDNGTQVVCQQLNNPDAAAAVLVVTTERPSEAILIACVVGGMFGTLLVFGLLYFIMQRSKTLQKFFGGTETEDDISTIVTKD